MMMNNKPTKPFVITCIAMLIAGTSAFVIGLMNVTMELNEKGYYFAILIFGLFSFVSLQKTVRDKLEGQTISKAYSIMCWVSSAAAVALLAIGLVNADLQLNKVTPAKLLDLASRGLLHRSLLFLTGFHV